MIAERDQVFMPRPVVPRKFEGCQASGFALIEYALNLLNKVFIPFIFIVILTSKETRRRELFGVTNDDSRSATGQSTNGVPYWDL